MKRTLQAVATSPQFGLVVVILLLSAALTLLAGTHIDRVSGQEVNSFLNRGTLLQVFTDASFFAIMAVGATVVIISGGIDLSVGAVYALSGVFMASVLRSAELTGPEALVLGFGLACAVGIACGLANGVLICGLKVHPFIITLGSMMVFRGVAFVTTRAESILVPGSLTEFAKATLGLGKGLYPVPLLLTLVVGGLGWLFLTRTAPGRQVFAIGGNEVASLYSGVPVSRVLVLVYAISGLCAGIAAYLGASYYGSASSSDGQGYELLVIASAVVGGASLRGGKGSAVSALLGALLIALFRQAVRTLKFDQNYEQILIGCAIIVAVVLDRWSSRIGESRSTRSQ
ncbi:MAG: ABC transporter permease [Armatimonadetes bacterium]|uniref:Monosaccharide ABC transporter membrane protein,CUT2 family n=1 Tax=Candidatus Nitrosymbiomonas proteolyticus TaxID=2608984 RepID=A0A809R8R1_9BACT|nr:ABC transporter permease [Armatimonadota bacterium]MCK6632821.1 ABC transporter permease [Fimbriimonadaceae bacterium]BBO23953.1 monosaccharide ABC transporter membrane protein,CUT2 family [Candidatus Nitrosymbiomonas proteolyticus]NOG38458.1 ABC transporter permease [Armatimonadota bacterium]NUM39635.1 ABC transporter permease [Armatimonadota bacterium]